MGMTEPKKGPVTDSVANRPPGYLALDDPRYIAGKFDPAVHPDFIAFEGDSVDRVMHLRTEAYLAFLKMAKAAAEDSITLKIISATRSFDYQKEIWENKWTGKTAVDGKKMHLHLKDAVARALKIMEYSAPPGFSRHHWGTDIDINSVEPEYFETEEGKAVYQWLGRNAGRFGYCQTYTELGDVRPTGFNEEKWHWSYTPIAHKIWDAQLKQFDRLPWYRFKGMQALRAIRFVEYLRNINTCP